MVRRGSVPYRARARRDWEPTIQCLRQLISPIRPIGPIRGIAPNQSSTRTSTKGEQNGLARNPAMSI
jgi:hypothetical protein